MMRTCLALASRSGAVTLPATALADQDKMLGQCRGYASLRPGFEVGAIEVKHKGKRTDGTQVVNGHSDVQPRLNVQCSFDSAGRRS